MHAGTVHVDDDMTALAAVRMSAVDNLAVVDDAATDARAERPEHEAAGVFGGADPELAVRGGVGVVLQERRLAEPACRLVANMQVVPQRQVRRGEQHAPLDVHRAGRGQADGMQVGDVQLGHEATVSRVSEEQLFYLQSRGLPEDEAMAMIVRGFIEPIARELPMEYALELNKLIEMSMEGSVG